MVYVEEYMTKKVNSLDPSSTVLDIIELVKKTTHDTFPVVVNSKVKGIISVHDIIGKLESEQVKDLMTNRDDMIVTKPKTNIMDAGRIMFRTGFSKLPVVDEENNILGIITNTDVIRSQIEKTTPKKLEKIINSYKNLGYELTTKRETIPINELIPTQSKVYEDELYGRAYELKRGLAEPIIVIKTNIGRKYILVDGHHRAVAAYLSCINELEAHVLEIDTDKKMGIEKTAEKQGLVSLKDVKIIDEDKSNCSSTYKLKSSILEI
ncbi:CBS domain containing protein [Methanococcus vannielii SB]|uniref:CBS domain containing protein n=1 Tax=Methanococcus vannielii (strain ATCC 35089 / DSM 1224 / JCM 13029 / OCM 148 / SB) TaxID=406327 RepID=A6URS4_METVS|nr:CBS domain-containing protein [Methanococcus vannielii]ABR55196.1 CBS domain containing protein [Methanococcus vannielii SB]